MNIISRYRETRWLFGDKLKYYIFLFFLAVLSAVLDLLGIGIIYPVFSAIIGLGDNAGQDFPKLVRPVLEYFNNFDLKELAILISSIFIIKNITKFGVDYGGIKITNLIRADWMSKLYNKYIYSNYKLFYTKDHGELLNNLWSVTMQAIECYRQLVRFMMFLILFILTAFTMLLISFKVTSVVGITLFFIYLLINRPIAKKGIILGTKKITSHEDVQTIPNDSFKGIREIKTYSIEDKILNQYKNAVDRMVTLRNNIAFFQYLPQMFPEILGILFFSIALIFISNSPSVSIKVLFPIIITYTYAALKLLGSASGLVKAYMIFNTNKPSVTKLKKELLTKSYLDVLQGNQNVQSEGEYLEVSDVSFSYSKSESVFQNLNIKFKKGNFYAIVGDSGAGKSTLADLILKIYDIQSGGILYDNKNINDFSLNQWRGQIGIVSQDTFLFKDSIINNIRIVNSQINDESIITAAKRANAHDFIITKKNGYDTFVGERGVKLSGGQRQRISLTRALTGNPKILILDEATSQLDQASEAILMKEIESLKKNIILIVIAHRLSTVINADKIYVLKDGKICENGKHNELMELKGEYFKLYERK